MNKRWAAGGIPPTQGAGLSPPPPAAASAPSDTCELITDRQHADLVAILGEVTNGEARMKKAAKVERLTMIRAEDYAKAIKWAETARGGA